MCVLIACYIVFYPFNAVLFSDVALSTKIVPACYPLDYPLNKDGYRYILAEPDPLANWSEFDQDADSAGKPIPGSLYRVWLEEGVAASRVRPTCAVEVYLMAMMTL